MKYRYEFEVDDNYFEQGCCYECPLSYMDMDNGCDTFCVLHCRYDECPLEKVDQRIDEENLKHIDSGKVIKE